MGTELVAAALQLDAEPRVLRRTRLFDVSGYDTAAPHANYDVSPDGRWFVLARPDGANHIVVLQNVPELARRIAERSGGRGERRRLLYYVMPFVEGESLRDRLDREKQLPIDDAVRIAARSPRRSITPTATGVIHRDIKPENILLHDGHALVADFGIALAVSRPAAARMTETGMSLGTPHYMSPEQAMGEREITARSDVYALGACLRDARPRKSAAPGAGPPRPSSPRYDGSAGGMGGWGKSRMRYQGKKLLDVGEDAEGRREGRPTSTGKSRKEEGGGAGCAPLAAFPGRESGKSPPHVRPVHQGDRDPAVEAPPAMSPDGRSVAYASGTAARMRVSVRSVAGGRGLALTDDTSQVQSHPRWSPDGSRVLFLQGRGGSQPSASGGADTPEVPPGRTSPVVSAAWSPDGKSIGYVIGDSLFVRDGKNESRGIAGFFEPNACQWSPGGEYIACASGNAISMMPGSLFGNLSPSQIVTVRVTDGVVTSVTDSLSVNQSPIWSPDGRWLYFVSNRYGPRDILAAAMSDGRRTGPAIRLTNGLNAHTISLAADGGRLAFASLEIESNAWSIPLPAKPPATASGETQLTFGVQLVETADISSDGRWLVYDSDLGGNADLYRMALPNGTPERLTTDPSDDFFPTFPPTAGRSRSTRGAVDRATSTCCRWTEDPFSR